MDTSSAGLGLGAKKVLQVTVYIVTSMVVVGLGMWLKDQSIGWAQIRPVVEVAGANLVFVFLQKWLSTNKTVV